MKSAYLLAGIRAGVLLDLIKRHKMGLGPRHLYRLLFLLQGGIWSSLLARQERDLNGARIEHAPTPKNPIFIVGHWRTGTTYLHQLMSLDPALVAPTLFQCCCPDSFMSSRRYMAPLLGPASRGTRPMDNVRVDMDAPHEDEFALIRLTGFSPLEGLLFPRSGRYFLADDETFLPPPAARPAWEEALVSFVTKVGLAGAGRPVLKNPFHTLRLDTIDRLFPGAVFIHITRDPLVVIPSTVHMWSVVGGQNSMRGEWRPPSVGEVAEVFERLETRAGEALAKLPSERGVRVRFEDLERDPAAVLESIYDRAGLEFSDELAARLGRFLDDNRGYQKNRFELDPGDETLIRERLGHLIEREAG